MSLLLGPLLGLLAGAAWAQVAPADGHLDLFLFDGSGRPVDAVVMVDGRSLRAVGGVLQLDLVPGSYTLTVTQADGPGRAVYDVAIVAGQATEGLLTLLPPDRIAAEVESADPAVVAASQVDGPLATVQGVVRGEDGAPVEGARLFAAGRALEASTDAQGRFTVQLPQGEQTLSFVRAGFAPSTQTVTVGEGGAQVEVRLVQAGLTLTYEVTAPRIEGGTASLLEERRESSNVSDFLGAEEMSRSGDSSAAGALKRVTGLTVVGGRYVYVRGLGERYSSSLLNGSMLPSPEPERRVVPLDLFPTSVLDSVVVQKTFSPDMPAEFGGGTVSLRTKGVPQELVLDLSLSGAYVHGSSLRTGIVTPGGAKDWLGIDDGTRALPDVIREASDDQSLAEGDMFSETGYSAEELEVLGEAVPNRWFLDERTLPLNRGASAALGYGTELADAVKIGALVAANYDDKWDHDTYDRQYYLMGAGGALEDGHSYTFDTVERGITLGGIGVAGLSLFDDHTVTFTSLLSRSTDDEARIYEGYNRDVDGDIRVSRVRWMERQLWYNQVRGVHELPFLHLPDASPIQGEWRYAWSTALRYEPDRREWRADLEPQTGQWILSDRPEGNQMVYSDLLDSTHDVGADLTVPFPFFWKGEEGFVKGGFDWMWKDRTVDTRRFKYMNKGERANDTEILSQDAVDVFVPENIGSDGFQYEEITRETDNYLAEQTIDAMYLMAELPITPSTRLMGGVRQEVGMQRVETYQLFNPDAVPIVAELETKDWLPAATVTQVLPQDMQVRAGYGRTVSRPDFRELSPATFNDVTGGRQTYGNPDLERATIDNVDLRWEWFFAPGEVLSLGVFYKHFIDPIEQIVVVSAQHSVTYDNADGATDLGAELDWRKTLGFLGPGVERLYFSGNLALIESRVDLGENSGIQSSDVRALQGQSPYVVNLQVGWDDAERGSQLALLYNVSGKRITDVGALGAPDSYELPVHQLDLVGSQDLPGGFQVGLKAKNLLDWPHRETQGDRVVESVKDGWELALKVGWGI